MSAQTAEALVQLGTWIALCSVMSERERQRHAEGWTLEHDDAHGHGDLAAAAACYAMPEHRREPNVGGAPASWPWDSEWWKPTPGDRRRELVKAAALIVAEIERLDRSAAAAATREGNRA